MIPRIGECIQQKNETKEKLPVASAKTRGGGV